MLFRDSYTTGSRTLISCVLIACCMHERAGAQDARPTRVVQKAKADVAAKNPAVREKSALTQATRDLIPEAQPAISEVLTEQLGIPSRQVAGQDLPIEANVRGGQAVYQQKCAVCHGATGDGAGSESKQLDPKPRDFRLGIFKWKSTLLQMKPTRHDLRETLKVGIPQTAMPAFPNLSDNDLNAVVEHIRWLSMRGQIEVYIARQFAAEGFSQFAVQARLDKGEKRSVILAELDRFTREDLAESVRIAVEDVAEVWNQSERESSIIRPRNAVPTTPESVKRGRALYVSNKSKCSHCHGTEGKGDGRLTHDQFLNPNSPTGQKYATPGLHDVWGSLQQPWDLNQGIYRGGDAPDDLYRRISAGIAGTSMPAYSAVLSHEEIWDLVNFLQSLRPEKLRGQSTAPRQTPPPGRPD